MTSLQILWIGIAFNIFMIFTNILMPWQGRVSRWYFEQKGGPIIMCGGWIILLTWMVIAWANS